MQRFAFRWAFWAVLFLPAAALAAQPGAAQRGSPQSSTLKARAQPPVDLTGASVGQSADSPPKAPEAERWRYRFQNGHWWHWGKTGAWSYWTGTRWVAYSSESYQRWYREWRLARDRAELARLKAILRSMEARPQPRPSWIRDPDSYFPFSNERGGFR